MTTSRTKKVDVRHPSWDVERLAVRVRQETFLDGYPVSVDVPVSHQSGKRKGGHKPDVEGPKRAGMISVSSQRLLSHK